MIALILPARIRRYALACAVALAVSIVVGAYTSYGFRVLAIGFVLGWLANMAARGLMRPTRPMAVIGRDSPVPFARTVLRARAPRSVDVPTRWRNQQGHVRYGRESSDTGQ